MTDEPVAVIKTDFSKVIREDGVIMDVRAFVAKLAETGMYWLVLSHGPDWGMVVRRMADDIFGKDREIPDPLIFLRGLPDEYPVCGRFLMPEPPDVCFIRKDRLPAEVLAVRFAVGVEVVRAAKYINLKPTAEMLGQEGLPKPTLAPEMWSMALH